MKEEVFYVLYDKQLKAYLCDGTILSGCTTILEADKYGSLEEAREAKNYYCDDEPSTKIVKVTSYPEVVEE